MKALKPKQKVAIDAPTRISSKFVRCSITFVFSGSWLGSRYLLFQFKFLYSVSQHYIGFIR